MPFGQTERHSFLAGSQYPPTFRNFSTLKGLSTLEFTK